MIKSASLISSQAPNPLLYFLLSTFYSRQPGMLSKSSASGADRPMNQPTQPGPEPTATPALDRSLLLPCVKCGYDLRGSDPEGTCPECGASVEWSTTKDGIWLADRDWALTVAQGCQWLNHALLLALLFLGIWVFAFFPLLYHGHIRLIAILFYVLLFIQGVILFIAQTKLTTPEPNRTYPRLSDKAARIATITRPLTITLLTFSAGLALYLPFEGISNIDDDIGPLFVIFVIVYANIQLLANLLNFSLSFCILTDLATRLNNRKAANRSRNALTLFFIATLLVTFVALLTTILLAGRKIVISSSDLICCSYILGIAGTLILLPISLVQFSLVATQARQIIHKVFMQFDAPSPPTQEPTGR
jgi:hypothetical protein